MTSDSQESTFLFQVVLLTSQYSIWARWAPPQERSQLITIAVAGN